METSDPELQQWLATATREDIEAALQVGWRNVKFIKSARGNSTTPQQITPVNRGQVGEEYIESILRERFSDITNMTKIPKSGDITLWSGGRKTIIEVKNYTNPVPSSGVEKFRRDLATSGAVSGVFISLQSPISGITSDFDLRLEAVEASTVPCAYIVSSDKAQITCAINMVIHFAGTMVRINRDTYSRDNILGVVREMSTHIDELAGMRNVMQGELADAAERAIKNSSRIMSTEVKLRSDVEKLQDELCETIVTVGAGNDVNLSGITGYDKLTKEQRGLISRVISRLMSSTPDIASTWKLTAKKCTHIQSAQSILFSAKRVQFSMPIGSISVDAAAKLITMFGSRYNWDGSHAIDISDETINYIENIISKGSF